MTPVIVGYGAVLSFETGDKDLSERIVGATLAALAAADVSDLLH